MRSGFACDNDDDDEERQLEYFSTEQTGNATFISSRFRKERALPPPFLSFFPLFSSRKGHLFVDTQDGRRKVQSNSGTKNSKKDPPKSGDPSIDGT